MLIHEGGIYRNIKTGGKYRVLFIAKAAWDFEQELVVYEAAETRPEGAVRWVRSRNEFCLKFEGATE